MIPHWIVAVIAFMGPYPVDSKFLGPFSTEAECLEAKAKAVAIVQGEGYDIWAKCMEVKEMEPKKEKPKGEPGTEQNS